MNVGFVGLGKLGYPCAVAMTLRGHRVLGYDVDKSKMSYDARPYKETGPTGRIDFNEWITKTYKDLPEKLQFGTFSKVVNESDIVFIAVQTPHDPKYEGCNRLVETQKDFDYTYLHSVCVEIAKCIKKPTPIGIISTVLPGTVRKHILPICNKDMKMFYNPSFIAMGTTMKDFLFPEFVLLGFEDQSIRKKVEAFWSSTVLNDAPIFLTTIENAEMTKMSYNTFISLKIVFANSVMEICHKVPGCNSDVVINALSLATNRIINNSYMRGGMGDGGGCHPRDNLALSYLARENELSFDLFETVMWAREKQTEWMMKLLLDQPFLPKRILGISYKPESNITVGSPAVLLVNLLKEEGHAVEVYDPFVHDSIPNGFFSTPGAFLVGTKHEEFKDVKFPRGSVVLDPWRFIQDQEGVNVIRIGEGLN